MTVYTGVISPAQYFKSGAYVGQDAVRLPLTRDGLASLMGKVFGLTKGAEIGVERGEFSETLCRENPTLDLLCVDAWREVPGYRTHVSQAQLDEFYRDTLLRLRPYRCLVRRGWSTEIATTVKDGSLDFVYIDAAHDFVSVIADIAAWAPKVRSGGIVAGHDFTAHGRTDRCDVIEAVTTYTRVYGIAPWYVLNGDRSPTWLWVKP